MRLNNKVAIVTGAGRGIGRAIATRFAEEGARLALIDIARDSIATTAEQIDTETVALTADVRNAQQVRTALQRAIDHFGHVDVLVNNAGILIRSDFLDHTDEEWDRVMGVNLKGAFLCSQVVARVMMAAGTGGRIINMGSIESRAALPGHIAYTASKGAILMLTKALALELAPYDITVNAIGPGVTETGMNADLRDDPRGREALSARTPLGRFATPIDIANTALFLASDKAKHVTGTILYVDGGWLAQ